MESLIPDVLFAVLMQVMSAAYASGHGRSSPTLLVMSAAYASAHGISSPTLLSCFGSRDLRIRGPSLALVK